MAAEGDVWMFREMLREKSRSWYDLREMLEYWTDDDLREMMEDWLHLEQLHSRSSNPLRYLRSYCRSRSRQHYLKSTSTQHPQCYSRSMSRSPQRRYSRSMSRTEDNAITRSHPQVEGRDPIGWNPVIKTEPNIEECSTVRSHRGHVYPIIKTEPSTWS
ncbi:uncharacterized protein LOC111009930 [Momordica charantia]|uniref:Uncharacterized protein LOC111009930 n=1 Tax=Momordica charantia TaxID=3673 RepID=A0A6J1CAY8_MOMCH|nr:uncharacterized protein LOC111009930 [Momordica charantia]